MKILRTRAEDLQVAAVELAKKEGLIEEAEAIQESAKEGDKDTVYKMVDLNRRSQGLRDTISDRAVEWFWLSIGLLVEDPPKKDIDNSPMYFADIDLIQGIVDFWESTPFDFGHSSNSQTTDQTATQ